MCLYLLHMGTIKMTVQERILELIESRGWSKYRLAKEIGLSYYGV